MTDQLPAIPAPRSKGNPGIPKNVRKVDAAKALQLRVLKGMTNTEIAKVMDCHPDTVADALKRFECFLRDVDHGGLQAYQENKATLLNAVELTLLKALTDEDRLAKASLNNAAYAYQQGHMPQPDPPVDGPLAVRGLEGLERGPV